MAKYYRIDRLASLENFITFLSLTLAIVTALLSGVFFCIWKKKKEEHEKKYDPRKDKLEDPLAGNQYYDE